MIRQRELALKLFYDKNIDTEYGGEFEDFYNEYFTGENIAVEFGDWILNYYLLVVHAEHPLSGKDTNELFDYFLKNRIK